MTSLRAARPRIITAFALLLIVGALVALPNNVFIGGRLFMGESQIQRKPRERQWLIAGLAFAHATRYVDAARDEPNRTFQAAWPTVRYL